MDVVVTVPKNIWQAWIEEGDAAGDPPTGEEWGFYTSGADCRDRVKPGDRCYVVAHDRLRGYAPITRISFQPRREGYKVGRIVFCRAAQAVAVTIKAPIRGFRGYQFRWWDRSIETPFPDWKTAGLEAVHGKA